MHTLLENSGQIHAKLKELFSTNTRDQKRVIVVAYVGAAAPTLLPDAAGITIYCNPQPESTNAYALSKLIGQGANVHFVKGLHMKLYWVKGAGAIVTSANLSTNALGHSGLHEYGVFLHNAEEVDIDRVVAGLDARPCDESMLKQMQREHDIFWSNRNGDDQEAPKSPDFAEWYNSIARREWKIGGYLEGIDVAASVEARIKREYDVSEPNHAISCTEKTYQRGDWILQYDRSGKGGKLTNFEWMFVQFVERVSSKDKAYMKAEPYQAVEATRSSHLCEPFHANKAFERAFKKAVDKYGPAKLHDREKMTVPPSLIEHIAEFYKQG